MECTLWKGGGIVLGPGALRIPWTLAAGPLQPGMASRACGPLVLFCCPALCKQACNGRTTKKHRSFAAMPFWVAVSEGFEPPVRSPAHLFSRQAPSTTRTTHRGGSLHRVLVWMTGLEPATSWSLTRCATNCATSRSGPQM